MVPPPRRLPVAFALALLILLSSLVGVAAVVATPAASPVVIEAAPEVSHAAPSGEQLLRLTGPVEPIVTLDPALARDVTASFFSRLLFRGLTRLDDSLAPVPELAERIEISADGLVYRFVLREAATFHDGRPIVAADVIASLTRSLSPATAGDSPERLGGPTYLSDIDGAEAVTAGRSDTLRGARVVDERTLELRLAAPRATFLMKLASPAAAIVDPIQVAAGADWWQAPNGSGPFAVGAFVPEERLDLVAFDGYAAGPPTLRRIEMRLGPTAANAYNLYQAGEIDVTAVPLSSIDLALDPEEGAIGEVSVVPLLATSYIAFRTDEPPLDDPAVRRALALAFPRAQLAEVGFAGHKLAADGLLPPGLLGREWPTALPAYDPEAARAALAESRYGAGEAMPPLQIYGLGAFGAETLRDTAGETLGIEIDVVELEWPDYYLRLARRELPAHELLWVADYPDPESFLWSLFGAESPDNFTGYANPTFDALLDEAAATLDSEARADLYDQAHRLLIDDGVVLPLLHDIRYTLSRPTVKGLVVTQLGILDFDGVWIEQ
ncbi:MAG: peptide ABC transporter substrate-binding protein [Chloroflexia bacterium]|nr:peptide ABC transporter substrate-binding protein [Chloroflexia bacterium]